MLIRSLCSGFGLLLCQLAFVTSASSHAAWLAWAETQPGYVVTELPETTIAALVDAGVGDRVELNVLAALPERKSGLAVRRIELFARGARSMLPNGQVLPRDERFFFVGADGPVGIGLSLDSKTGELRGIVADGAATRELVTTVGKDGQQELALVSAGPKRNERIMSCETTQGVHAAQHWTPGFIKDPALMAKDAGPYEATVAIDTDNEFLAEKFNNDTAAADAWISDMFVATNAFMQRDLGLTIVRGTTILRPEGQPDPYQSDVGSSFNFLGEFGGVWIDTPQLAAIDRQFAALLSGRSVGSNQFSGIAWLNAYCSATPNRQNSGSFSVNRIGSSGFISPGFIAGGFGHELGHNLGSAHTHCERLRAGGSQFVDQCFNAESGCYSGPTACPVDRDMVGNPPNTGSLMSYCNFSPGSGGPPQPCDASDFFHPLIASKLTGLLDANAPRCIREGPSDIIFSSGFE